MTPVQKWLNDMKDIWLAQEPDRIVHLLANDLEYHETPFTPPLTSIQDVVCEWQAIKTQNIEKIEIEVLHEKDNTGVAIWHFKEMDKPLHIGCYFLQLNEQGKCTHFRQWWNEEK